jgi:hypothetical protein
MAKRPVSIFLLVVAVLLSAWGDVIAAAYCPGYSSRNCCIKHEARQAKQVDHKSSCQHGMADMDMADMQMESENPSEATANSSANAPPVEIAASSVEQVPFHLPTEPCGHCWMHSQPSPATAMLVAVDPSKRSIETHAPPSGFVAAMPSAFVIAVAAVEHGPPIPSSPRHVIINVFRI